RNARAPLTNLAVTNGNSVRLSLDNDTKSTALAARSPRHGASPGNYNEFRTSDQIIRSPRRRARAVSRAETTRPCVSPSHKERRFSQRHRIGREVPAAVIRLFDLLSALRSAGPPVRP